MAVKMKAMQAMVPCMIGTQQAPRFCPAQLPITSTSRHVQIPRTTPN